MVWLYGLRTATNSVAADGPTAIQNIDIDDAVRNIRQRGFYPGLQLRPEVTEQLLTFSSMATCYADGKSDVPFLLADKSIVEQQSGLRFKLGRYNHALQASPVLKALASDPQLVTIARKYLKADPVLIGARMWWSFSGPADVKAQKEAGQGFHYDLDGYRAIAFFFYLTDVGHANGPHIYVRGTHAKKALKHIVTIHKGRSDDEIDHHYGRESQVVCCGPAGTGFAEDIFGFHKGQHPESGERLLVQLRYGLRDYGTGLDD
ncbi:MAG: phytanoyl-CoA dioxygenase family protein [Acidobacteriaceae bacterium]